LEGRDWWCHQGRKASEGWIVMTGVYMCAVMDSSHGLYESNFIKAANGFFPSSDNRYLLNNLVTQDMFSVTTKKRLRTLKPGMFLPTGKHSNQSSRGIYHLTPEQCDIENELDKLRYELRKVNWAIDVLIPNDLREQKKDLDKKIRNLAKDQKKFYGKH
jgi:hypothetical protein